MDDPDPHRSTFFIAVRALTGGIILIQVLYCLEFVLHSQQGAYNSGKHGNLREFVNSGKLEENSGNLKFTQGIYHLLYDSISWASSCVHNCQ